MKKINMKLIAVALLLLYPFFVSAQNQALEFDGAGDYVQVALPGADFVSGDFTVELWLNADAWEAGGNWNSLVSLRTGGNNNWQLIYIGGQIAFWYNNNSVTIPFGITPTANKWHHLALVRSGTSWILYLDGVEVSSQTNATAVTTTDYNLNIGSSGAGDGYFDGEMDEIRIWDDVRTLAEIRANMYRELPDPAGETDLVAYYKFNEIEGISAADSKGTYTGTLSGLNFLYDAIASPAFFGPKNAMEFDGTNDYIFGSTNYLPTGDSPYTLEAWIYADAMGSNGFMGYGVYATRQCNAFRLGPDGLVNYWYGDDFYAYTGDISGAWHHVAITYDQTTRRMYLDGIEIGSNTPTGDLSVTQANFYIGLTNTATPERWDGKLDEIRIWSVARTANQIRENMFRSLTGNEAGLAKYFNMDVDQGTAGHVLPDLAHGDSWADIWGPTVGVSSTAFNNWLNTINPYWTTATNWSLGSVPVSVDNVGFSSDFAPVDFPIDLTLNNLFIGGSVAPTIGGSQGIVITTWENTFFYCDLTITGIFIFQGKNLVVGADVTFGSTVNFNQGDLILEHDLVLNSIGIDLNSGSLIEVNGIVSGDGIIGASRSSVPSPNGYNFAGLGAVITSSANLGSTNVYRRHISSTNPTGIHRQYIIEPTNNINLDATLVFNYDNSELNGLTEAGLSLYESANGTTWVELGGTLNTTNNTLTVGGLNAFPHYITASDYFNFNYSDNKCATFINGGTYAGDQNYAIPAYETSDFTAEFMIRLDEANQSYYNLIQYGSSNFEIQKIGDTGYDGIRFFLGGNAGIFCSATLANSSGGNMGKWHHVACTYNSTSDAMKLYVDGVLIDNSTYASYAPESAGFKLYNQGDGQATMDEVRYWNYERSEAEIQENMYKVIRGNDTRLLLYLRFDQTPLIDNSPLGTAISSSISSVNNSDAFNTWLGDTDSDWATTSNWGRGSVPGVWDNVGLYSFASNNPQLPAAGTVSCQNLILGAGAEISQATGTPPTISLSNNLIINGTWGIPTATVNLNGPGGAFWRQPYLTGTVDPLIINTLNLNYNYRIGVNLEVNELTLNTTANDVSLSVLEGNYVQVATQFDNDGGIFLDEGSSFILNDGATANCNTKWMLVAQGNSQQHALYMKDNSVLTIGSGAEFTATGNATLQSGTTLTLESDVTGTGSFLCTGSLTNNSGTMTAQRYIAGWSDATHGWHQLSSPVTTQAISPGFVDITGTMGDQVDFLRWSEPLDLWVNIKNADDIYNQGVGEEYFSNDVSPAFIPGKGYLVAYGSTDTKTFSGTFNNSSIPVTGLTKSDPAGTYNGWNFLGNPFPSALLWGTEDWLLGEDVDNNCQIWNEQNASYTVISSGNDIIPAMNGFMVHASVNNASLTIPAAAKVHNDQAWYKGTGEYENGFTLLARDPQGSTAQPTIIRFDNEATDGYDSKFDSYFLTGYAPVFYSKSAGKAFALNTLPNWSENLVIPLYFTGNGASSYIIEAQGLENFEEAQSCYLYDRKTGTQTNLLSENNYSFTSDENDDPYRFDLRFKAVGTSEINVAEQQLYVWHSMESLYVLGEEGSATLLLFNAAGQCLFADDVVLTHNYSIRLSLPPGIYIVKIVDENDIVKTAKVPVQ
ncbi:MAG: T9SS type A sorting domain-containing protein [Bacteroidales bacterium]|nr:T9SS type A sorting domain-containing protein [Bacteroidales bacterium]